MNKKILLVYPPWRDIYENTKVRAAVKEGYPPPLATTTLAASLRLNKEIEVELLDMDMLTNPIEYLKTTIQNFWPDYVGITCLTPSFNTVVNISNVIKSIKKDTKIIVGGPHPSALPKATIREKTFDMVVIGEGDTTLVDIVSGKSLHTINGICFRDENDEIVSTPNKLIKNLDDLPYPSWELIDIRGYKVSKLMCKKSPVGPMETSRGCVYGCTYCNKTVFGRTFRYKSPERTVGEIESMLNQGFKEIHIMDDGFTTDIKRAKKICDLIIEKELDFCWNLTNGIRVDRIDKEFLEKAYEAGCYRTTIGVESGDQNILNNIKKGVTLKQFDEVFKMTSDVGIDTLAYFMLALPGETKSTMRSTIDFAKKLDPTVAKVSVTLPLPGTPLFDELDKSGYIKSKDWSLYNQHDPSKVYDHPNLDWSIINEYYEKFYKEFYLRGSYIVKRLKRFEIISDIKYFLNTKW